jgi:ribose 5-phosphate isomerase A
LKLDLDPIAQAKKNAALQAVQQVKDNFIVGLGSGTTVAYAIEALGERVKKEHLNILGIPSSYQAFLLAVKYGVAVTTLDEHPIINLTIDGADQVTPDLHLIKGMGAALAREKIIAAASKLNIIIVDASKKVSVLGQNHQAVPVEVLPFALALVKRKLIEAGANPTVREGKGKLGPIITDNGNVILDVDFGEIADPVELEGKIKLIPGVLETGLFNNLTDIVYVASADSTEKITRKRNPKS